MYLMLHSDTPNQDFLKDEVSFNNFNSLSITTVVLFLFVRSNKITDFPITNDGDDAVEAPNQFTKSMSKIIYTHPELFQNSDQFFVQTKMWIKWWKTMLKELGGLIVRNEKDLNDFQKYKLYLFIKKQLANTLAE
ncbi:hypothetical protein SNEBB_000375 [Seison nebaliae]|nr:hypothetical protein SNEBB_000375 [Seison nebaliae]